MRFEAIHRRLGKELLESAISIDPRCLTATGKVIEMSIHHFELDTIRCIRVGNNDLLTGSCVSELGSSNLDAAI